MKYLLQITSEITNTTYTLYKEDNYPILLIYKAYGNGEALTFTLKFKYSIVRLFEDLIYRYPQYTKEFSEMINITSELKERNYYILSQVMVLGS